MLLGINDAIGNILFSFLCRVFCCFPRPLLLVLLFSSFSSKHDSVCMFWIVSVTPFRVKKLIALQKTVRLMRPCPACGQSMLRDLLTVIDSGPEPEWAAHVQFAHVFSCFSGCHLYLLKLNSTTVTDCKEIHKLFLKWMCLVSGLLYFIFPCLRPFSLLETVLSLPSFDQCTGDALDAANGLLTIYKLLRPSRVSVDIPLDEKVLVVFTDVNCEVLHLMRLMIFTLAST